MHHDTSSIAPRRCTAAAMVLMALGLAGLGVGCASKQPQARLLALPSPFPDQAVAALPSQDRAVTGPQVTPATGPATSSPTPASRRLQVARVDIPEYWQSRAVRFRHAGQNVGQWPNVFWAERVEVGMSRNLTAELAQQLPPGWSLCTAGCGPAKPQSLRLSVSLLVLDYDRAARSLQALARWSFVGLPAGEQEHSVPLQVASTADSPEGQAEAVSRLLEAVAARVVQTLPADR